MTIANMKSNCWQYKNCGRIPGGEKADELGICPVFTNVDYDGVHHGEKAGRACWIVAESLCGGQKQGSFTDKFQNCKASCDFFSAVKKEEENSHFGFAQTPLVALIYKKNKLKQTSGV